jgi:ABC-type transporter Mla subunit MlaD
MPAIKNFRERKMLKDIIELRDQERHADMKMKVDAQAHDTIVKTQTQLEVEQMKAQVALLLAQLDRESLKNASAETTERAI